MVKSRKSKKAGRRSTRRGGAFKSVVEACRKILDTKSERQIKKHHADALKTFKEMSEEEQNALDTCMNAALNYVPKEEAEQAIRDLEGEEEPAPVEAALAEGARLGIVVPDADKQGPPPVFGVPMAGPGGPAIPPRGAFPYGAPAVAASQGSQDVPMSLVSMAPASQNTQDTVYTPMGRNVIMRGQEGGKKRKSRKGGRKHKTTRRH